MKFTIEFTEDDIAEFLDTFGDEIKENIKKKLKSAIEESDIKDKYYVFEDMIFKKYDDANDTLNAMHNFLMRFGKVTVFDLYDICGYPTKMDDRAYGWTDLKGVGIRPGVKEGWIIDLPAPKLLN